MLDIAQSQEDFAPIIPRLLTKRSLQEHVWPLKYSLWSHLEGPVEACMTFYFQRPKHHFRTGKFAGQLKAGKDVWHNKKKDLDNLVKFVLDSLNALAYIDDGQVCSIKAEKFYTNDSLAPRSAFGPYLPPGVCRQDGRGGIKKEEENQDRKSLRTGQYMRKVWSVLLKATRIFLRAPGGIFKRKAERRDPLW